ncbi:SBBP repeat-containing protein [Acidobacteriota bacterium]
MKTESNRRSLTCSVIALIVLVLIPFSAYSTPQGSDPGKSGVPLPESLKPSARNMQVDTQYGNLPLRFELNRGQADSQVRFMARSSGLILFLTQEGAVFSPDNPEAPVLRMRFPGSDPEAKIVGQEELSGRTNYFKGRDPKKWLTGVPAYRKVMYKGIYPGVDVVFYGHDGTLEYDFVLAPGADPGSVRIAFDGQDTIKTTDEGNLVLSVPGGALQSRHPEIYQLVDGKKQLVQGRYVRKGKNLFGFQVASYDAGNSLVIDPIIAYSTYLGGRGEDIGEDIVVDGAGSAVIVGHTDSRDFPTESPYQPVIRDKADVFITKLMPDGQSLAFSTFIGGNEEDWAYGVALDPAGGIFVTGYTMSFDFPVVNPIMPDYQGSYDAFVMKLSADGSMLEYSTYIGGAFIDVGHAIALDDEDVWVAGITFSTDFPTQNPVQSTRQGSSDVFVLRLSEDLAAIEYSTYWGGDDIEETTGMSITEMGYVVVSGYTHSEDFPVVNALQQTYGGGFYDGFVFALADGGIAVAFSTYLGGADNDSCFDIDVDGSDNIVVTGSTRSSDFPIVNAFQPESPAVPDAFVTKITEDGSAIEFSTFLGGSSVDSGRSVAVDVDGYIHIGGNTKSDDFPLANPYQAECAGDYDAFITKLSPDGAPLAYSTYLGGQKKDNVHAIALDATGDVYLTGWTRSSDFPVINPIFTDQNGGHDDVFVTKILDLDLPTVILVAVDISPGACPNSLEHVHNSQLVVSILGTPHFDVTWIDPLSLRLRESVAPIRSMSRRKTDRVIKDRSAPVHTDMLGGSCDCWDGYEDGYDDLTVKFSLIEVLNTLDVPPRPGQLIPLRLSGKLKDVYGGSVIDGKDCLFFMH